MGIINTRFMPEVYMMLKKNIIPDSEELELLCVLLSGVALLASFFGKSFFPIDPA